MKKRNGEAGGGGNNANIISVTLTASSDCTEDSRGICLTFVLTHPWKWKENHEPCRRPQWHSKKGAPYLQSAWTAMTQDPKLFPQCLGNLEALSLITFLKTILQLLQMTNTSVKSQECHSKNETSLIFSIGKSTSLDNYSLSFELKLVNTCPIRKFLNKDIS